MAIALHETLQDVNGLAEIWSDLANPSRILILYTLSEKPYHVHELTNKLGLCQQTISSHLKILHDRGLVNAKRQGRTVEYSLADKRLIQILDLLLFVMRDALVSGPIYATGIEESLFSEAL